MNALVNASIKQAFHIEEIFPSVDCGRFPVKRIVGETIAVWADIYRDGHEIVAAELIWRGESEIRLAAGSDDPSRERPLGRILRAEQDRPLHLCNRSVDGRIRHLATWL
jgi:hypothetical protein